MAAPARSRRDGELLDVADAVLPTLAERGGGETRLVVDHEPKGRLAAGRDFGLPGLEGLRRVALDLAEGPLDERVHGRALPLEVEAARSDGRRRGHGVK